MAFNLSKLQISLLIALVMLPLSGTLIHLHVHPDITWILYLTLFDVVAITALYLHDKLRIYGFWLNTLICLAGVVYHIQIGFMRTLSDNTLIIADIMIGYALLLAFEKAAKRRRK